MFECDRCGKETKVTFLWQYHLDTVGWNYSENICEKCYFVIIGSEFPTHVDISHKQLPTLGVYDA